VALAKKEFRGTPRFAAIAVVSSSFAMEELKLTTELPLAYAG
jgi:hypothetical protein